MPRQSRPFRRRPGETVSYDSNQTRRYFSQLRRYLKAQGIRPSETTQRLNGSVVYRFRSDRATDGFWEVVFNPDGTVRIGNLRVVGTTAIPYDTFYALDTRATAFVRRLNPELRMFEDATLAKKNQIMFRIEERAALAIFNNAAIVKGVLQTS